VAEHRCVSVLTVQSASRSISRTKSLVVLSQSSRIFHSWCNRTNSGKWCDHMTSVWLQLAYQVVELQQQIKIKERVLQEQRDRWVTHTWVWFVTSNTCRVRNKFYTKCRKKRFFICIYSLFSFHLCFYSFDLFYFFLFIFFYIFLMLFLLPAAMLLFYVKHFELFCTWNVPHE